MSALAPARRRLAELAAHLATGDERSEVDELTSPAALAQPPTAPLNSSCSFTSSPAPADLSTDAAFADWSGSLASCPSDRLLSALRRQAAAGDAGAARQAVKLADYLAACDRGEIELPEHPNAAALRDWNRLCDERARTKGQKPSPKPAGRRHTGPPLPAADCA